MDELEDVGPKLLALPTVGLRRFVLAYTRNGGNAVQASTEAGSHGPKMYGHRALLRNDVQEAVSEVMQARLKEMSPAAVAALGNLIADVNHKDHSKAIFAVLDRTGFHAKSEHKSTVEHVADKDVLAEIKKLASELGMDAMQQRKLIGYDAKLPVLDAVVEDVDDEMFT